jgi:hypothetical protein
MAKLGREKCLEAIPFVALRLKTCQKRDSSPQAGLFTPVGRRNRFRLKSLTASY